MCLSTFPRCGRPGSQAELLPAQATEKVGHAQALLEDLTDVLQRHIARLVPPLIVDLLEVVDVEQHQHQMPVAAFGLLNAALQGVLEAAAAGHAGQRVGLRQALQLLVGLAQAGGGAGPPPRLQARSLPKLVSTPAWCSTASDNAVQAA